jgi:hypothetical protein
VKFDPHSVRFASTSPPINWGEEVPAAKLLPFPLPHQGGERWIGEAETEWRQREEAGDS